MKILNTAPVPSPLIKFGVASRIPGSDFTIVDAHRLPEEKLVAEVADADLILGDYTGTPGSPAVSSRRAEA